MRIIEGNLNGEKLRICIVASRFNDMITSKLVNGAVDTLIRHGVKDDAITVIKVPGSFEIPQVAQKVLAAGGYNAVICLGAVVRGDTPHFNYVAAEVSKGISVLSLQYKTPVVYGIVTADTFDQAIDRAGGKAGNRGSDAAATALEMANLLPGI
jgi:6,7-dimethyl-8-ribityllumazine synthase